MSVNPQVLARYGVELLQEAVLSVLEDAPAEGMSFGEVAEPLGLPHGGSDWTQHLVKQVLLHMERQQLVTLVDPDAWHPRWRAA